MKQPPVIVVQLIHILGPLKGQIQEFFEPTISIGRHSSCHLRFPADLTSISRKHADIIREGNQFKLVDHSVNGTYVNGKRVQETYLKNGDVLTFAEEGGPKVSFLSEIKEGLPQAESKPPAPAPPPPPREEFKPEPQRPLEVKPPAAQPVRHPVIEEPAAIPPQTMKVSLVIQYGPTLRSFKQLPITIGKNPHCDFKLEHPAILDQHTQIFYSQNQYWVKDLTGQRSVRINHQPISLQAPLKLNDDLSLSPNGPTFRFIGEGRLVESADPSAEEPSKFQAHQKEQPAKEEAGAKTAPKGSSFFKRLFNS